MENYLLISTLLKILLGVAGIFGISQLNRSHDRFLQGILILMVISMGLQLIASSQWKAMGILLFVIGGMAAMVYAIVRQLPVLHKVVIMLISLPVIIASVSSLLHLRGAGLTRLFMLVSILLFLLLVLPRHRQYKKEIGFLTITILFAAVLIGKFFLGQGLLR